MNPKYEKLLVEVWSESPSIAVVDLQRYLNQRDLGDLLDAVKRETIKDEFFCLNESIIDRHLFRSHGPEERGRVMGRIGPEAKRKYAAINGRSERDIIALADQRLTEWGQYSQLMTKEGPGGLLYHVSQHLAQIITGNRRHPIFLSLYNYLGEKLNKTTTILVSGYIDPESVLEDTGKSPTSAQGSSTRQGCLATIFLSGIFVVVLLC